MDPPRDAVKARSDGRAEQRRRREDVLARQKARRASALAQTRGLPPADGDGGEVATVAAPMEAAAAAAVPFSTAVTESFATTSAAPADSMDTTSVQVKKRAAPADALMSAEWMVDVPSDLAERWYVAARPAGRRCLVVTANGTTKAHWRGSGKPRGFPSSLPNGSRFAKAGLCSCELDCIWREADQTFFVIDCLVWKDQRLVDCPSEFRLYWLGTKLAESKAAETHSRNPCRFVPLAYAPCTAASLQHAYAGGGIGGGGIGGGGGGDGASDGGEGGWCSNGTSGTESMQDVGGMVDGPSLGGGGAGADEVAAMDDDQGGGVGGGSARSSGSGAAATPGGAAWRDGLLLLHRDALYEAGSSPLLLSWSDAHCSKRFYDYGSQKMDGALKRDPQLVGKWRTEEVEAAVGFGEILHALEAPPMALS